MTMETYSEEQEIGFAYQVSAVYSVAMLCQQFGLECPDEWKDMLVQKLHSVELASQEDTIMQSA
jgi:hypothetical protein